MFNFSSNTKVEQKFKIADLLKMIKADKQMKAQAQDIASVQFCHALSEATTGLKPSEEVNEIYVIQIDLKNEQIPYEFIKALDRTIHFQVLFALKNRDKTKYITDFKAITEERISQSQFFESSWLDAPPKDMPLVGNLTELYKQMLIELSKMQFRAGETIKDWLQRNLDIEKLEKEFKKIEKQMKAEVQPKKQLEYNNKLREIYQQIREKKDSGVA